MRLARSLSILFCGTVFCAGLARATPIDFAKDFGASGSSISGSSTDVLNTTLPAVSSIIAAGSLPQSRPQPSTPQIPGSPALDATDRQAKALMFRSSSSGGTPNIEVVTKSAADVALKTPDNFTDNSTSSKTHFSLAIQATPEPGSLAIFGVGGVLLLLRKNRNS